MRKSAKAKLITDRILMSLKRPATPTPETLVALQKFHGRFVENKKRELEGLRAMLSSKQKRLWGGGVTKNVQDAVFALNGLPFLCTVDSGHARIFEATFMPHGAEIGARQAKSRKRVVISPANLEAIVDASDSNADKFIKELLAWQVKKFPLSRILVLVRFGLPFRLLMDALHQSGSRLPVSPKRISQQIKMSNDFIRGLTRFVNEYRKRM